MWPQSHASQEAAFSSEGVKATWAWLHTEALRNRGYLHPDPHGGCNRSALLSQCGSQGAGSGRSIKDLFGQTMSPCVRSKDRWHHHYCPPCVSGKIFTMTWQFRWRWTVMSSWKFIQSSGEVLWVRSGIALCSGDIRIADDFPNVQVVDIVTCRRADGDSSLRWCHPKNRISGIFMNYLLYFPLLC